MIISASFQQDIESRTSGVKPDDDDAVALEVISLVGVVVSVFGLVLTIITLLAFRYHLN